MLHVRANSGGDAPHRTITILATDDTTHQRFRIELDLDKLQSNCTRAVKSKSKRSIGGAVTVKHVGEERPTLPPGYSVNRSVLGTYRWRFEVNGIMPDGQRASMDKEEAQKAAWDHWTKTGNAANHALPTPIGVDKS